MNIFKKWWFWCLLVIAILIGRCSVYKYINSCDRIENKIDNAIYNKDFANAHKWLTKLNNIELTLFNSSEFYRKGKDYPIYHAKLFNAEVSYLLNDNSIVASDRIVQLIMDYGFYGSPVVGVTRGSITRNNDEYMLEAAKYNQMLDGVLNRAIAVRNQYLAEKLLEMYKPTLTKTLYDTHTFSSDEYNFEYSDEPKERAKENYNKAVKEKKF